MRESSSETPAESDSLAGSLLLAHPALKEATFRRTAILISNHDAEGAMGVVLNRPMGRVLSELGGDFALGPLARVPLFCGGPVEPQQLLLCAWRPQVGGGGFKLFFGISPERAAELAGEDEVHVRAFLGYAGWTGGQLEGELERETWVVADLVPDLLTQKPDETLWRRVLGGLDPEWKLLAGEPDDPGLN
jgi:putative transcriptional regulator